MDVSESQHLESRAWSLRYSAIYQQLENSIMVFTPDGVVREINEAWKLLWGISQEFIETEMLGKYNVFEDPQIPPDVLLLIRKGFSGETVTLPPMKYEPGQNGHPGRPRWIIATQFPVRDEAGRVVEVLVMNRDVTLLMEAEEKLKESEERLRSLVEAGFDGVVLHNQGIILDLNNSYAGFFGYLREELLGKNILDLVATRDREKVKKSVETESSEIYEILGLKKDGSVFPLEVHGRPCHYRGQRVRVTACRDLTAQVESAMRFQTIAESIPHLVWTTNSAGYFTYLNHRMTDYAGKSLKDAQVSGLRSVVHSDQLPRLLNLWQESASTGDAFEIEIQLQHVSDREYRWFLMRCEPLRNTVGVITAWFGTCTEIEEQKRSQAKLEEAVRARDLFLSIASHELKTPLTTLVIMAELRQKLIEKLPDKLETLSESMPWVKGLLKQVLRLSRLVNDLLDASRINSGQLLLNPEKLDLRELTREILDRLAPEALSAKCPLEFDAPHSVLGYWDYDRIEQVVMNLINNALKYGAGREVQIRISSEGKMAKLTIRDRGIGIAPADQDRIFMRFERAISENEISGLGLGLHIVKTIVEAHRGSVQVNSELGKGSEFVVLLPLST